MTGKENEMVKRIPYGVSDFVGIRQRNGYYVDKTAYVEKLEEANDFFFFIRPRRFGKSLLLSMLSCYYDVAMKERFDELFGDLYIGQHPTPLRNAYLVLKLNFSVNGGRLGYYKESLDMHCENVFQAFCETYAEFLPEGISSELKERKGAINQLDFICRKCKSVNRKIYLFIDEYDHFTNDILSSAERLNDYESETHGEGYLRQFFNSVKANTETAIEKCFITGVSPVTLDDLTSGFNIATNYTTDLFFNGMVGFTEAEVREMLNYYASATGEFSHSVDELIQVMAPFYDHYCFAEDAFGKETIYNSNMVLYFVNNYLRFNGKIPKDMLEANIRTDYDKLRMLIRKDQEYSPDTSVIQTIVGQGYITGDVKDSFSARTLGNTENLISLLFYFGMLTFGGTIDGRTKLVIPNYVVREQLYKYLLDICDEMHLTQEERKRLDLETALAYKGEWIPYFDYLGECLKNYTSTRDAQKGEALVHGFSLAMISLNKYFYPHSEPDCNGGYADIILSPRTEIFPELKYCYVIELKYLKLSEPESNRSVKVKEAEEQLNRYAESTHTKELARGKQIRKLLALFHGMNLVVREELVE
jgi:hypothetical protein